MFGSHKRKAETTAVAIENSIRPHFFMSQYLRNNGEFIPPNGFYRDPYIFGYTMMLAGLMRDMLHSGKNWSTQKKGEYILCVYKYLDKGGNDRIVQDFLELVSQLGGDLEFERGKDDATTLFGAMYGILNPNDPNAIAVEARELAPSFDGLMDESAFALNQPSQNNGGMFMAVTHLTIKKHIDENYSN